MIAWMWKPFIVLLAQHHLEKLYQEFGFASVGEAHLEDGIPHIDMRWSSSA